MIAIDTNILVYAHRSDSPFHEAAVTHLVQLAEGGDSWAIPWPCVHEFLAIVTHPKILKTPTPLDKALAQIEAWLESPSLQMIGETSGYWDRLKNAMLQGKVAGPITHDARIFAICRDHRVRVLWSADRDFSRFSGVKIVNPTVSGRA